MKIKCLRSIVKSLADMAVSSRIHSSFDYILDNDIDSIGVDLCNSNPSNSKAPLVNELESWFAEQLSKEKIRINNIDSAILNINLNYKKVATNLDKVALFHISSRCNLSTTGKQLEASSYGKVWHTRRSA